MDVRSWVLISLQTPTREVRRETASAGFYKLPGWNKDYPRLQLITIEELLSGGSVQLPPGERLTFKGANERSPRSRPKHCRSLDPNALGCGRCGWWLGELATLGTTCDTLSQTAHKAAAPGAY